jgi:membrane protease YdiL (CAAX protease family)
MVSALAQISAAILTGGLVYILHRVHFTSKIKVNVNRVYPSFVFSAMYFKASLIGIVEGILFLIFAITKSDTLITSNAERLSGAGSIEMILTFVSVVIAAPLIEEVLFRGLLYGSLRDVIGIPGAILISGIVFGVLHLTSVGTVIVASAAGIAMAYIYAMSGNLAYTIILHSLVNLIVTLKVFIHGNPMIIENFTGISTWAIGGVSVLIILICFMTGTLAIKRMKYELKKCRNKGKNIKELQYET